MPITAPRAPFLVVPLLGALGLAGPAHAIDADAGGPYVVPAESTIVVDASGGDFGGCVANEDHSWDLFDDGAFEVLDSASPTATISTAGIDGPWNTTLRLRVECTTWFVVFFDIDDEDTTSFQVLNVDPVITDTRVVGHGPDTLIEGTPYDFEVTWTDVEPADTHTVQTTWSDGPVFQGPRHTRSLDDGVHTATFQVTDDDGGVAVRDLVVTVANVPPTITSVQVPDGIVVGDQGVFLASATDPADTLTYDWSIDDGSELTGSYATWVAPAAGTYGYTLEVSDGTDVVTRSGSFEVFPAGPAVTVQVPSAALEGTTETLVATPADGSRPWTYTWTTSDGGSYAGRIVSWAVGDDGLTDVTLVADDGTEQVQLTRQVTVANEPPTITTFLVPPTMPEGATRTFAGGATDRFDVPTLSWTVSDGSTGSGASYAWTAGDDGPVDVTLTADDGTDAVSQIGTVDVTNVPPTLGPISVPGVVDEGETVTLSAIASDVFDVVTVTWAFSDGSLLTGDTVDWTAGDDGTVTVTVTADDGTDAVSQTRSITVRNLAPTLGTVTLPSVVDEGSSVQGTASGSDPYDDVVITWLLPDGSHVEGATATWTAGDDGREDVTVEVSDGDATDATTRSYTVRNVAPTIDTFDVPATAWPGEVLTLSATASDPHDPLTYTWTVDGTVLTGPSVTWTPPGEGSFVAQLAVADDDTQTTRQATIVVDDPEPELGPPTLPGAEEGVEVLLVQPATDPDGGSLSWTWDPGDGSGPQPPGGPSFAWTYADDGAYDVTVTVTDLGGQDVTATLPLQVDNRDPELGAVVVPTALDELASGTFSASATDVPADTLTYTWDLDDGTVLTGSSVSHAWAASGRYLVTLTVTDEDGGSTGASYPVDVAELPPELTLLDLPTAADEGQTVTFTALAAEPTGEALTTTWAFEVPGGTETRDGPVVDFTWTEEGTYGVDVLVEDEQGATAAARADVVVSNVAPTVLAVDLPERTSEGAAVPLVVSTADPGGDPVSVRWLDGGLQVATGLTWTPPADDDAVYDLRIEAMDDEGAVGTLLHTFTVDNLDPTAGLTGDTSDAAGPTLSWTATGADVPADTLRFDWDVGDGTTYPDAGTTLSHTYTRNGRFPVVVTVTDDDGGADTATLVVDITGFGPVLTDLVVPDTVPEGSTAALSCTADDQGLTGSLTYTWDFGDGAVASGAAVAHAWADEGAYDVVCLVVDGAGESTEGRATLDVVNVAPTVLGSPATTAVEGDTYVFAPSFSDPGVLDVLVASLPTAPPGATVDPVSGRVTWAIPEAALGPADFVLRVSDGDGGVTDAPWIVDVAMLDADLDRMSDLWEGRYGLDPTDPTDAGSDDDGDGRTALEEFEGGTDPTADDRPDAPVLIAPIADAEIDDATPDLLALPALSPVGDPLTYEVEVWADSGGTLVLAAASGLAAPDAADLLWTVDVMLPENEPAWWTARAVDPYAPGPWATPERFVVDAVEEPPPAPRLAAPADGTLVSSLTPELHADPVVDPDDEPVTYAFVVYDDLGAVVASADGLVEGGGEVRWTVDPPLADLQSYCFEATAEDPTGLVGGPAETWCFDVDLTNDPPEDPTWIFPVDASLVILSRPGFTVRGGEDPEGRPVVLRFQVDTSPAYDSPNLQTGEVDLVPGVDTVWVPPADLVEDAEHWARVQASDGDVDSAWVPLTFLVDATNSAPTTPVPVSPDPEAVWDDAAPLEVANSTDVEGDVLVYAFRLLDDEGAEVDAVAGVAEDPSGFTAWSPERPVPGTYTWQAQATDAEGASSDWSEARALRVPGGDDLPNDRVLPPESTPDGPEDERLLGCGCATPGAPGGLGLAGLLLALAGLRRRRSGA